MTPDEFDHIRADVRTAIIQAQWEDPPLMPDLINYLLVPALGSVALDGMNGDPRIWAQNLLRASQLRAISRIPFADREEQETYWSEHL